MLSGYPLRRRTSSKVFWCFLAIVFVEHLNLRCVFAANTDLPRFYHLIKTHKTGPVIKIRPIVSHNNGPTQRLSWLLANALKLLLKDVPAHPENSLELIKYIQAGDFTTNKTLPYPCSLDHPCIRKYPYKKPLPTPPTEFTTQYSTSSNKTLWTSSQ